MTVSSSTARADYNGNGVTVAFTVPFRFLANTDLQVIRTEAGVSTTLILNSIGVDGYSVSGAGQPSGGTVTLVTAPTLLPLQTITILRSVSRTQLTDYIPNDPFPAEAHERALDKLTMIAQEVDEALTRTIVLPPGLPGTSATLPAPESGTVLGWNGSLDGLENVLIPDMGTGIYTPGFSGSFPRLIATKLRETVSITDFGAVMDDATDNFAAIFAAINSGAKHVIVPPGTAYSSFTLSLPAGVKLEGMGSTIRFPQGVNGINLAGAGSSINNITLDGTANDDVIGGSGVILYSDGSAINVTCNNWGFHGFATPNLIGAHRNSVIGCKAFNTGHRGINMSNGSTYNKVTNFQARGCKRAGIILGYKANYNVFSDIFIDGYSASVGGAGLWVHMNSDYNVFNNVVIGPQDGFSNTAPSLILAAGCQGNTFSNIKIRAAGTRGILVWNLAVDHPELGTADAPLQENRFNDVDILGTGEASSAGIILQSDSGLFCINNQFDRFYINGFTDGVWDNDSLSAGCEFRNFRFGASITSRKMRVGNSADQYRTSRRVNCQGLTGIGSLASAMTEYDTQPTVAATGVAVTQPYPFPVMIFLAGMAGTTAVQINGVNVNSTLHDLGNGTYILQPGQTITLVYTSGTPNWRWFGL